MQKNGAMTWKDPAVAALIEKKKVFNKKVSLFINDVIHFKKMMNGWPSKFREEKGKITAPIPQEASTVISKLMSDYQEIGDEGKQLIGEQYSLFLARLKRRNQRTQKPQASPTAEAPAAQPAAPAPDLASQIKASEEYYLISEASNPLTRFFNQLLSPGIGLDSEAARIRKYRVSLLNTSADLYKGLKKLQSQIVKSGPQTILLSANLLDKVETDYIFISSGLQSFKEALPQGTEDDGGELPPTDRGTASAKGKSPGKAVKDQHEAKILAACASVITDVQSVINSPDFPHTDGLQHLIHLSQVFHNVTTESKLEMAGELASAYKEELAKTCEHHLIPLQNSFRDIQTHLLQRSNSTEKLQAVAQNFLGKWRHQLSPFDKTSAIRLDVYKLAGEARENVDTIMNELEKGLDSEIISPHIALIGQYIQLINAKIQVLKATTRGVSHHPQFMNMLQNRQLSDYNIKLSPKEQEKLKTLVESRRLREIEKMEKGK